MDTMNRILQLLLESGHNQKDLTDSLNIDKSTFTAWKQGKSKSYNKYMPDIAEYFGVSTDYLLGLTDDPTNYDDNKLIADIPEEILRHFDGNVKAAYKAWKSRTEPEDFNDHKNNIEVKPKLRSLARLENDEFSPEEDKQILDFIDFIKSKRGE